MDYTFEWDPAKAKTNAVKHDVSFEEAATTFLDPRAISVFDKDHSIHEERWVTLGISSFGRLIVLSHIFIEDKPLVRRVRIISARRASKNETRQYKDT